MASEVDVGTARAIDATGRARAMRARAVRVAVLCHGLGAGLILGAATVDDPAPRQAPPMTLSGAAPADCAQANSDYERYELGCPLVEAPGSRGEEPAPPDPTVRAAAIIFQSD